MDKDLQIEVLPKRQRELFSSLSNAKWILDFYLAGGTALALQIGHRRSIDFDFFTEKEFNIQSVKLKLIKMGIFELLSESEGTLNGRLNSVQISFFNLPYTLVGKEIRHKNLRIVSKEDIAAMKLAALSSRGSRKDFIDLYFLLEEFTLAQMFSFFEKRYGKNEENVYCALKGLVYFKDADGQEMPSMIKNVSWREIKKRITLAHKKYIGQLKKEGQKY